MAWSIIVGCIIIAFFSGAAGGEGVVLVSGMMVISLLDDDEGDDEGDDGKGLTKARRLGLLRGVDASLFGRDRSRGSSGQGVVGVVENCVNGFGGHLDGLPRSG